jgi:hypothetical protein
MKNLFIRVVKLFSQRLFSILWRICLPFEWIKLKFRYRNYHISFFNQGKGEMFKFILRAPEKKIILLKKDNLLTEFWVYLNSYFHITMKPTHHNFQDKADVLELILKTELKNLTLLISVDRKNKEYLQEYREDSIDLAATKNGHEKNKMQDILDCFSSHGIMSYDHTASNFIVSNNTLIVIDLESFQFIQDKHKL